MIYEPTPVPTVVYSPTPVPTVIYTPTPVPTIIYTSAPVTEQQPAAAPEPQAAAQPEQEAAAPLADSSGAGVAEEPAPQSENPYYPNCAAARDAGAAPIYAGEPGYRGALDRDGDGIACER